MTESSAIVRTIQAHYPETQGIYLFGTHGTPDERPDSDVDIAILLPWDPKKRVTELRMTPCHDALMDSLGKLVDLVNLRCVSTVFQMEILRSGRRVYCGDDYAVAEFEMLTLSFYQKLNEERKEILDAFLETGRAYPV